MARGTIREALGARAIVVPDICQNGIKVESRALRVTILDQRPQQMPDAYFSVVFGIKAHDGVVQR